MLSLNIRIIEEEDVVVIRGLEFPNVIVQGGDRNEAEKEFLKALEYFFTVKAKIEEEKYPLLQKEKTATLGMELVGNEQPSLQLAGAQL